MSTVPRKREGGRIAEEEWGRKGGEGRMGEEGWGTVLVYLVMRAPKCFGGFL